MSRAEGNLFFFQIFFFGKGNNRCIKKNKENLQNKWRVNIWVAGGGWNREKLRDIHKENVMLLLLLIY